MNRSRCKICKFLRDHVFAKSQWNNEVSRGDSLNELRTVLRTLGLDVSKSTISRHLVECEGLELYQTKTIKLKKSFKRVSNFFIKPKREERDNREEIPCYTCGNLARKEDLVFDCELHVYLCEKCFFGHSLDRKVRTSRKDPILYDVLTRRKRA